MSVFKPNMQNIRKEFTFCHPAMLYGQFWEDTLIKLENNSQSV